MTWREPEPMGRQWAAVAQVIMALGEELSLEALIGRTLDKVLVVLRADAAGLFTLEENGTRLHLAAQRGLPTELVRHISLLPTDQSDPIGEALNTDVPQILQDGDGNRSRLTPELLQRHGFEAIAILPLRAHGQKVGVITFLTLARHEFDQSEIAIAEVIAHAIAAGILNSRAFEAERRMRTALQAVDEATLAIALELEPSRVLQAIVDQARVVTGARYAALGIGVDPERSFDPWVFSGLDLSIARAIGPHPRARGLLGAVPAEGRIIRIRDLPADGRFKGWPPHHPPMKSFLGVPILLRGEAIGNLYLADKIGAPEFSAEDERAANSLATHAAIAYRHAQLFSQAQSERNRLEAVVESSPLGMVFVEANSGYAYINKAAEELFGIVGVPDAGRHQYIGRVLRPEDGGPMALEDLPSSRALRGEPAVGVEAVIRRPDGREVPVLANAAPIRDAQGHVTGAVVLWQDVSPLKLEQLREEFISLVAHELRAPIAVIAGYGELLSRHEHSSHEARAIESIRVSARRLDRLVQDLLDASRIEARRLQLEPRVVDLTVLVKEVTERMKAVFPTRDMVFKVRGKASKVEADPGRIEQVLINLLSNAVKYSPDGTEIVVNIVGKRSEMLVSVINDGPGIASSDIPRLFTRFFRTDAAQHGKAQGLGLGLYIARGLIEAQGGRIWAESELGKGAVFYFALPVCNRE